MKGKLVGFGGCLRAVDGIFEDNMGFWLNYWGFFWIFEGSFWDSIAMLMISPQILKKDFDWGGEGFVLACFVVEREKE